jgi:hypothetical protein
VDAVARRPDSAGLADAARVAHEARRAGRPRQGARTQGGVREAALDLLPRGRLRGRLPALQRPGRRVVASLGAGRVPTGDGPRGVRAPDQHGRDRQPAEQPRGAPRLVVSGLVLRLREQGPAPVAGPGRARSLRARVVRGRAPHALPGRARALAACRAERGSQRDLSRRQGVRGGRPVVLRRDPAAPGRRRHAAAHPLGSTARRSSRSTRSSATCRAELAWARARPRVGTASRNGLRPPVSGWWGRILPEAATDARPSRPATMRS